MSRPKQILDKPRLAISIFKRSKNKSKFLFWSLVEYVADPDCTVEDMKRELAQGRFNTNPLACLE